VLAAKCLAVCSEPLLIYVSSIPAATQIPLLWAVTRSSMM
jgi:hypothetical protein